MSNTNKDLIEKFFDDNKEEVYSPNQVINAFVDVMDRATVYRQLSKLEQDGKISKTFNKTKDTYEYRYSCNCRNHLHLICQKCGKIVHLNCSEANNFINHLLQEHGFSVDKSNSNIYGICNECANKLK